MYDESFMLLRYQMTYSVAFSRDSFLTFHLTLFLHFVWLVSCISHDSFLRFHIIRFLCFTWLVSCISFSCDLFLAFHMICSAFYVTGSFLAFYVTRFLHFTWLVFYTKTSRVYTLNMLSDITNFIKWLAVSYLLPPFKFPNL